MSTRYVYSNYDTSFPKRQTITKKEVKITSGDCHISVTNGYYEGVSHDKQGTPIINYVAVGGTGVYIAHNSLTQEHHSYSISDYKYAIFDLQDGVNAELPYESNLLEPISGAYWHSQHVPAAGHESTTITFWVSDSDSDDKTLAKPFYQSGGIITKGSSIVSYESKNKKSLEEGPYKKFADNNFYWRAYLGSDNIDPSSVRYSYSSDEPEAGEPITITVSPRTPTYGGTVYYQYQYSTDGGNTWANYGGQRTATSVTMTVPDAERFQARVLASDGWGFTSSTYVYGPAKEVSQLKAYVGIGGKAVALKKGYVGVGGKAMQLAKGYVGVGGVAKKLF